MKKTLLIVLALLIVIGLVAVVTCPKKDAHKEAITNIAKQIFNDSLAVTTKDDATLLTASTIGYGLIDYVIDSRLVVNNYFVFSTGDLQRLDGKSYIVSVGAFGHIFTIKKEHLLSEVNS